MGIYIKGIEMPRNNYIKLTLYPNGDYVSRTYNFWTGEVSDEHLEFEAITEVPVPHGRLIDVDRLITEDYTYVEAPTVIEGEVEK